MSRRTLLPLALLVVLVACATEQRPPRSADAACFGARILSFQDLAAEVVIPQAVAIPAIPATPFR